MFGKSLAAISLVLAAPIWAATAPITLTLQEYPPFMGDKLPYKGLLTRLVLRSFELAGYPVTLEYVPNNRAIEGPRKGLYAGSFGWARNPDREKDLLFTDPVMPLRMVFCQQKGRIYEWKTLEDLSQWKIGITAGNFYSDDFAKLQQSGKLQVDAAQSDVINLRKLVAHRIDLFPIDAEVGPYLMARDLTSSERNQLSCQQKAYWEAPLHVVISKHWPQASTIVSKFNAALEQMHKSGEFERLLDETRKEINATK